MKSVTAKWKINYFRKQYAFPVLFSGFLYKSSPPFHFQDSISLYLTKIFFLYGSISNESYVEKISMDSELNTDLVSLMPTRQKSKIESANISFIEEFAIEWRNWITQEILKIQDKNHQIEFIRFAFESKDDDSAQEGVDDVVLKVYNNIIGRLNELVSAFEKAIERDSIGNGEEISYFFYVTSDLHTFFLKPFKGMFELIKSMAENQESVLVYTN